MRKIEAFFVTFIIGLILLPIILLYSVISFFMEIYFNIHEMFSDSEGWEKALITKAWETYWKMLKECYNKII